MIRGVRILDFRSIRDEAIEPVLGMFAIAGRNGTGKSNVLRALNLFFNNEIEAGVPIDLSRDFHRAADRKDKRVIRVEVQFELPIPPFRWRSGSVGDAATELGFGEGSFRIAREWSLDPDTRGVVDEFYHQREGSGWETLSPDRRRFVELLITRLIRYRYVPNHVHPITLIAQERANLQHTLITKLNRSRQLREALDPEAPLAAMAEVATELVRPVVQDLASIAPEIEEATMATPSTWADVALALDVELRGREQQSRSAFLHGSGHQSVIAISMLHLIDSDYSASFGWHQGTIWGLEEPEAYLHQELVYQLSTLLARYAEEERFQVLLTTHSPTAVSRADSGALIETSGVQVLDTRELIDAMGRSGVGPFVHPLLLNESKPLLLVEGPSDRIHLDLAYDLLGRPNPWTIFATTDLDLPGGTGGFKQLVQNHGKALAARRDSSPVIALLDHRETAGTLEGLARSLEDLHPRSTAKRWDPTLVNPDVDLSEFRGIEAFISTEALEAADDAGRIRLMRPTSGLLGCRDLDKVGIAELCVERGDPGDYRHFIRMLAFLESQLTNQPMMTA